MKYPTAVIWGCDKAGGSREFPFTCAGDRWRHLAQTVGYPWIPQVEKLGLQDVTRPVGLTAQSHQTQNSSLQGQFPLIDIFCFCQLSSTNVTSVITTEKVCFSSPLLADAAAARLSAIKAYQPSQLRFFQSPTWRASRFSYRIIQVGYLHRSIHQISPGNGQCLRCP